MAGILKDTIAQPTFARAEIEVAAKPEVELLHSRSVMVSGATIVPGLSLQARECVAPSRAPFGAEVVDGSLTDSLPNGSLARHMPHYALRICTPTLRPLSSVG